VKKKDPSNHCNS